MKNYRTSIHTYTVEGYEVCDFLPNTNAVLADSVASQIISFVNAQYSAGQLPRYELWCVGLVQKTGELRTKRRTYQKTNQAKNLLRVFDAESPDTSISTAIRLIEHHQESGRHQTAIHHSVLQTFLNQSKRFQLCPDFRGSILHDLYRYAYCYCIQPQHLYL